MKTLKTLAAIILGCACMAALPVANASAAKPDLCAHECGGKWGAYEHAKKTAENMTKETAYVEWCKELKEGSVQWQCQGYTAGSVWNIKLNAYGETEEWNEYR